MTAPANPQARWGMSLTTALDQVHGRHWEPSTLTQLIAARLDVDPKHVGVAVLEHLGRPYLQIEVAI